MTTAGHRTNEQVSVKNYDDANFQSFFKTFCEYIYIFKSHFSTSRERNSSHRSSEDTSFSSHLAKLNLDVDVQNVSYLIILHFHFPKQNFQQRVNK